MAARPVRSALVTGGTGFIGAHLVKKLHELGWSVGVLARNPVKAELILPAGECNVYGYDGSYESLSRAITQSRPEAVFHLASHFVAEHSTADIESLLESNICLGTRLLEAMASAGVRYFVNTGTSWQHFHGNAYEPVCLYAATKQAFEDILAFYCVTQRVKAVTLKLFDTYGPGDTRRKILPALRKAVRSGEILGMSPGEQLLDLVYIDDVVDAFVCAHELLERSDLANGASYAVTSGHAVSLRDLVELVQELTGGEPRVKWGVREYRAREVMKPWNEGEPVPGWAPRVGLREGLDRFLRSGTAEGLM